MYWPSADDVVESRKSILAQTAKFILPRARNQIVVMNLTDAVRDEPINFLVNPKETLKKVTNACAGAIYSCPLSRATNTPIGSSCLPG